MVTESLAHAHLAGTSFRPERLQLIDEDEAELSNLLHVLILPVVFFDLVAPDDDVLLIEIFFDEIFLDIFVLIALKDHVFGNFSILTEM